MIRISIDKSCYCEISKNKYQKALLNATKQNHDTNEVNKKLVTTLEVIQISEERFISKRVNPCNGGNEVSVLNSVGNKDSIRKSSNLSIATLSLDSLNEVIAAGKEK